MPYYFPLFGGPLDGTVMSMEQVFSLLYIRSNDPDRRHVAVYEMRQAADGSPCYFHIGFKEKDDED